MSWAKRRISELALGPDPKTAGEILARGDIVYVVHEKADGPAQLAPDPGSARARWSRSIRTTARSCRWSAASTTSAARASTTA